MEVIVIYKLPDDGRLVRATGVSDLGVEVIEAQDGDTVEAVVGREFARFPAGALLTAVDTSSAQQFTIEPTIQTVDAKANPGGISVASFS